MRYEYPHAVTRDVPGQKFAGRQLNTPHNCRRLLSEHESRNVPVSILPELPLFKPMELFYWQTDAICTSLSRHGVYLNHATAAGKTYTAARLSLTWAAPRQLPIVWVTLAPLKPQVRREFLKRFDITIDILEGETLRPIPTADIVVVNYDILPAWREVLTQYLMSGIVVFDEIHTAKSSKRTVKQINKQTGKPEYVDAGNITAACAALSRVASRRIGLSATPMPNTTADLWAQLDLIEPDCWGTWWDFVHHYCAAYKGTYGLVTEGQSNTEELKLRLAEVMHVVTKEEVASVLPEMTYELITLSRDEQCRPLAGMAEELKRAAKEGPGKLREARFIDASSRKRKWVADYVEYEAMQGSKLVVMTGRRADVTKIVETLTPILSKHGIPVWGVTGGDTVKTRDEVVLAYMAAPVGVLVGTDCLGTGTELQDTDVALMLMLTDTQGDLIQWMGRFNRPGQARNCRFKIVVAEGTIDEEVGDNLINKLENLINVFADDSLSNVTDVLTQVNAPGLREDILAKV